MRAAALVLLFAKSYCLIGFGVAVSSAADIKKTGCHTEPGESQKESGRDDAGEAGKNESPTLFCHPVTYGVEAFACMAESK